MNHRLFFAPGQSNALSYAVTELKNRGMDISLAPSEDVTHLLLPVPCRMTDCELATILEDLPGNVHIFGGLLKQPILSSYHCRDLLDDDFYLAQNARITAYCAAGIAMEKLPVTMEHCPVLILGWGRIGKCLSDLLRKMGAEVTVAARKTADRAMITALGCSAEDIRALSYILKRYRVIFNTVPHPILSEQQLSHCRRDCIKIELASAPGFFGTDVIQAKGLPGTLAPESSGKLIAKTVLRLCAQEEELE